MRFDFSKMKHRNLRQRGGHLHQLNNIAGEYPSFRLFNYTRTFQFTATADNVKHILIFNSWNYSTVSLSCLSVARCPDWGKINFGRDQSGDYKEGPRLWSKSSGRFIEGSIYVPVRRPNRGTAPLPHWPLAWSCYMYWRCPYSKLREFPREIAK